MTGEDPHRGRDTVSESPWEGDDRGRTGKRPRWVPTTGLLGGRHPRGAPGASSTTGGRRRYRSRTRTAVASGATSSTATSSSSSSPPCPRAGGRGPRPTASRTLGTVTPRRTPGPRPPGTGESLGRTGALGVTGPLTRHVVVRSGREDCRPTVVRESGRVDRGSRRPRWRTDCDRLLRRTGVVPPETSAA